MKIRLLLAVLLVITLAVVRPPPSRSQMLPLAPALTHIGSVSLQSLDPQARPQPRDGLKMPVEQYVQQKGTPAQRQALQKMSSETGPNEQRRKQARQLRVLLEQDALQIAALLGSERVGAMLQAKPQVSAEVKVWEDAAKALP